MQRAVLLVSCVVGSVCSRCGCWQLRVIHGCVSPSKLHWQAVLITSALQWLYTSGQADVSLTSRTLSRL